MSNSIVKHGPLSINELLGMNTTYTIPDYQREYSWERDLQVYDMWADIKYVLKNNIKAYFFGQIVALTDSSNNRKYIIDGQQRMATSIILFAALKKVITGIADADEGALSNPDVKRLHAKLLKSVEERIGDINDDLPPTLCPV